MSWQASALTFKSGESIGSNTDPQKTELAKEDKNDRNNRLSSPIQVQIANENCEEFSGMPSNGYSFKHPETSSAVKYAAGFWMSDFGICREHLLIFPSHYSRMPLVKGVFAKGNDSGGFNLTTLPQQFHAVRDYAEIRLADGSEGVVFVETGLEITRDHTKWPHGRIWIGKLTKDGLSLEPIDKSRAFYHSVATGDIDGDGLDDIVTIHMGTRDKQLSRKHPIYFFKQTKDGKFKKKNWLNFNASGGSAVALIDLNNDGRLELLQGNYKKKTSYFKSAIRIFSWQNGKYKLAKKIPRQGIMNERAGINKIIPIDFDNDGDHDLLVQLEGGKKGFQLYNNRGDLQFENDTIDLFGFEEIDRSKYQWREAVVADFNFDGFDDIILQGWSGNEHSTANGYNLGAGIFLNENGRRFTQQSNLKSLFLGKAQGVLPYSKHFFRYAQRNRQNWFYAVGINGNVSAHLLNASN